MNIRSAVTVSLVPEARGGPFVFWDDLQSACAKASALRYHAVEIFPPGPEAVDDKTVRHLLDRYHLDLAAVGTGAGWVKHKLHLCMPNSVDRKKAIAFVKSIIDVAGAFKAPAIIGSMQGRHGPMNADMSKETATGYLIDALNELGVYAQEQHGTMLIYEPLNRYETNLCNTVESGVAMLTKLSVKNVVLLADLFHANIEEVSVADAIKQGGAHIGHVHFVDSNRRPAGCGHIDYVPIVAALKSINYTGYASAEAFPYPDSDQAAKLTMDAYLKYFG